MKIAFISRSTLFSVPGGDTRQMQKTAEYLRKQGVEVDIYLSNAIVDYSKYDLLHFFNITRPADIIKHIHLSEKPFVVSPIFVEYGRFNEKNKGFISRKISELFSADNLLYLKTIARWILNGERIISKRYILLGQRRSVAWIAKRAACLLPNSENEMQRFMSQYSIGCPYHVVPNGIDAAMLSKKVDDDNEYKNAVICMARFEPLKTQLSLIKALNNTSYKVFLHGKPAPNHHAYYQQCSQAAAENIQIRDWLDHDDLCRAYGNAKVHVLPSYFETTGLVSLEAAVMGCNVVVTDRGDQRSYFGDDVWYCEPDNPESIKKAVDAAFNAPYNAALKERILEQYTWQHAAEETLKAYRKALIQIYQRQEKVNYQFNFQNITQEYRRFVFEGFNEER